MNLSRLVFYDYKGYSFVITIDSGFPDDFKGCYWQLYDATKRKKLSWGESGGFGGDGMGAQYTAERLAKVAARRRAKQWAREEAARPEVLR